MQALVEAAPQLMDFLGEASLDALRRACARVLDAAGQPYRINPRLVRGMDYYNLTVFEWVTDQPRRAGHGLRRRPLRRPVRAASAASRRPAIGWGLGIERVLDLLQQSGIGAAAAGAGCLRRRARRRRAAAWPSQVAEALRAAGVAVLMHAGGRPGSMKSQFKRADASGARYALVFGADELARGEVARQAAARRRGARRRTRPLADAAAWAAELRNA